MGETLDKLLTFTNKSRIAPSQIAFLAMKNQADPGSDLVSKAVPREWSLATTKNPRMGEGYMHVSNVWVNESDITQPHALKCSLEQEYSRNHQNTFKIYCYVAQIYQHQSTGGQEGLVQSLSWLLETSVLCFPVVWRIICPTDWNG